MIKYKKFSNCNCNSTINLHITIFNVDQNRFTPTIPTLNENFKMVNNLTIMKSGFITFRYIKISSFKIIIIASKHNICGISKR